MAKDKLFFKSTAKLNKNHVPAFALILQCVWTCLLVLPRTVSVDTTKCVDQSLASTLKANFTTIIDGKVCPGTYGNLYGTLLDYVVFAVLIFYILTIIGIFILRRTRPEAERPYKAFGYPFIPIIYIAAATLICLVLLLYKPSTSLPGLAIVLTGVPVYFIWRSLSAKTDEREEQS